MYLRSQQPRDFAAMFALDRLCFAPPFQFPMAAMRRFASAKNAIVRIACERPSDSVAEQMLGFCIVHLQRSGAGLLGYIVTLDVDPAERGRGVGFALMDGVERAVLEAGAHAMGLHVYRGNEAAIRLYERLGYVHGHVAEGFYGPGRDALVYRKTLSD